MSDRSGLWRRSRPWRRVTVLTVGGTLLLVLLGLRACSGGGAVAASRYAPPPALPVSTGVGTAFGGAPGIAPVMLAMTSTESHDAAFDLPVTRPVASRFPADTELHALGVYKGALPPGERDVPWWQLCQAGPEDREAMSECHRKYAGQRKANPVTVSVRRGNRPVVLALMAYEPVLWKIDGADSGNIRQVILAGHYGQDIEGLPDSVPVVAQTNEASPCRNCARQSGGFFSYDEKRPEHGKAVAALEAQTGLKLASFQGSHESAQFTVSGSTMAAGESNPADAYLGQEFRNAVTLAGTSVLLPEGVWQGVAFEKNKGAAAGEDELLVLARLDGARLAGVYAVRVQTSRQRQGFRQHRACREIRGYVVKTDRNEAFGPQLCHWVTHVTEPWTQPVFAVAADKLAALKIGLPDTVIASGLRQADMATAITTVQYANPALQGLRVPHASWAGSEWQASRLAVSPARRAFVDEQVKQAGFWYQVVLAQGR